MRLYHVNASGRRDRRITLIAQTQGVGASNFPIVTDGTSFDLYASKEDVSGLERLSADQMSASFTTRWEVPYTSAIDPELVDVPKGFVLEYQGRRHDITSASMIGRKEGVELTTLARQG